MALKIIIFENCYQNYINSKAHKTSTSGLLTCNMFWFFFFFFFFGICVAVVFLGGGGSLSTIHFFFFFFSFFLLLIHLEKKNLCFCLFFPPGLKYIYEMSFNQKIKTKKVFLSISLIFILVSLLFVTDLT